MIVTLTYWDKYWNYYSSSIIVRQRKVTVEIEIEMATVTTDGGDTARTTYFK